MRPAPTAATRTLATSAELARRPRSSGVGAHRRRLLRAFPLAAFALALAALAFAAFALAAFAFAFATRRGSAFADVVGVAEELVPVGGEVGDGRVGLGAADEDAEVLVVAERVVLHDGREVVEAEVADAEALEAVLDDRVLDVRRRRLVAGRREHV